VHSVDSIVTAVTIAGATARRRLAARPGQSAKFATSAGHGDTSAGRGDTSARGRDATGRRHCWEQQQ